MKLNCVKICESKTKLDEGMKKRALSIYNIFFSEYSLFFEFFLFEVQSLCKKKQQYSYSRMC